MSTDKFYMEIAKENIKYANCHKKQLGCILVLEDGSVINGWNGPPSGIIGCDKCPREDSHSATNLDRCRAVHAERRVLLVAAKHGRYTDNSILYSFMGVPCKDCMVELIEAGVQEIVCVRETYYDELSKYILDEWIDSGGIFRIFNEVK